MLEAPELLKRSLAGSEPSSRELGALVYDELKRIAGAVVPPAGRRRVDVTSIVHDAYVRLLGRDDVPYDSRLHFLRVAAVAVRRVLVDRSRRDLAAKRGGGARRVTLDCALVEPERGQVDALTLDEALLELAELHERQARIVEGRFFGGMTTQEVAAELDISVRTAEEDWRMARAWLSKRLKRSVE